jgi:hypothetical protein
MSVCHFRHTEISTGLNAHARHTLHPVIHHHVCMFRIRYGDNACPKEETSPRLADQKIMRRRTLHVGSHQFLFFT